MNWLYYLAEANIYLVVFYLAYYLLLNKETYYTFNRVYLLCICIIAFILPLIQLDFLKPTVYVSTGGNIAYSPVIQKSFTWQDGFLYSYLTGVIIFAIQFVVKLYQLQKLARLKPAYSNSSYKLVYLEGSTTAFSFFGYLFIGTDAAEPEMIIRHELVHIRQKHSADVMLLELLKIINWFNPAVYFLQNSLKTVHEYIADEQTALSDTISYSTFLVNNAYGIGGPSFTHSFFNYNLLKKRIIMLHQKRSGNLARLKYLIALPLCAGLLCESTLGFSKTYGFINIGNTATVLVTDTVHKKKLPPPPKPPLAPVHSEKAKKYPEVPLTPPPPPPASPAKGTRKPNLPPPPKPPKATSEIGVLDPAHAPAKKADSNADIRIDEPVPAKKPSGTEIRIEDAVVPAKKATNNETKIDESVSQPKPQKKS